MKLLLKGVLQIRLIVIFFLITLQACDNTTQTLFQIPVNGTILAFGDSLTVGKGVDRKHSYPSVLSALTGKKVINAGVSGETTRAGLQRFEEVIIKSKPDLIILLEGGNDILRNHNMRQTKHNLATMIDLASSHGIQLVLIGVPAKALISSGSAQLYEELAEEKNLVFESDLISDLLHDPSYKSDSVHFNQEGYKKMAENIHALLIENGAL